MQNRFELKETLGALLDKSPELTSKEWEVAYIKLYNECDKRILLEECLEEAIQNELGEEKFIQLLNQVGNDINEILDAENGELDETLSSEQEQLLKDLFK